MSHYETLGVPPDADVKTLHAAYKKQALRHHPDRHSHPSKASAQRRFEQINAAYSVLSDPEQRRRYDYSLSEASLGGRDSYQRSSHFHNVPLRAVQVSAWCTIEQMGGWRATTVDLGAPELAKYISSQRRTYSLFLEPGCSAGDVVRVPLHHLGIALELKLEQVPHARFERSGSDLRTTVWLPAWHNAVPLLLRRPVLVSTVCGRRERVHPMSRAGASVRSGETCVLRGFGLPFKGCGDRPWTVPRGDLHVRLELRSVKASLWRAAAQATAAVGGATLLFCGRGATAKIFQWVRPVRRRSRLKLWTGTGQPMRVWGSPALYVWPGH